MQPRFRPGCLMKTAPIFAIFLLLMGLQAGLASSPDEATADRTKLIALENAWNLAQLHHDAGALDALVAPTFVYTDYDGTVMNKEQFLADIKDTAWKPTLVANEGETVYAYPNSAIVTGTYHTKGIYKGKPYEHFGRFTDTWMYLGGRWQCVASHTNLIQK